MSTLATLAQLGGAGALVMAAAAKIAAPDRITATLTALGASTSRSSTARNLGAAPPTALAGPSRRRTPPPPRHLAMALVATELVAAMALATHPAAPISRGLVVVLGTAFALAGLHAHHRGITIACNCFGGRSRHRLGLRQVAAWPLWIAVAALAPGSELTGGQGLRGLAVVTVAVAAALAGPVLVTTIRTRRHLAASA